MVNRVGRVGGGWKMTFLAIFGLIFDIGEYREWIPEVLGTIPSQMFYKMLVYSFFVIIHIFCNLDYVFEAWESMGKHGEGLYMT